MSIKFLVLFWGGGGIWGFGGVGGEYRFYFYGRGDFSDDMCVFKTQLRNFGAMCLSR